MNKFATLPANNQLAKTLLADCFDEVWQTVGGKRVPGNQPSYISSKKL
ncbi:hypothetical protein [Peribacillus frigoritolerans]|uniref:Uncharacterized protein n=1 Tax=Peribacillus castrilensis TaxID=2897690 RepID=A0AAW9N0I2_9BACI|nr:hypothetical protein [Peribacillus castrilensis]